MKKYEIVSIRNLGERVNEYKVYAPLVCKHCKPGQFIILRTTEDGERVPFTISGCDPEHGIITIVVQEVGYTTSVLAQMHEGECLQDFVGPLGNGSELEGNVVLCAGGLGAAVLFFQAKQLYDDGNPATVIVGARNKNLFFYTDEFKDVSKNLYQITDDGSNGNKGFVTDELRKLFERGERPDVVEVCGPLPMMKAVCELCQEYGVKSVASMCTTMICGISMCGNCRCTLHEYNEDGTVNKDICHTVYACTQGPDFDGNLIDFDEAIARSKTYRKQEADHRCRIRG